MKATAVLLNWRRPYNLQKIVTSLSRIDVISEIIVWNNSGTPLDDLSIHDSAQVIWSTGGNMGTYGRYLATAYATNELIYTQDDDCIVKNVPELYERFMSNKPGITAGLADKPGSRHYEVEAHKTPWIALGWGAFFLKSSVGVLDKWKSKYGEDELLIRKADRIFTVLCTPHDPIRSNHDILKGPNGVPSERDENALWRQKDHYQLRDTAVKKALSLK